MKRIESLNDLLRNDLLKNVDRNTKYFHRFATERRRSNRIKGIRKEDGTLVKEATSLKELITDYYTSLFTSHTGDHIDELLQSVTPRVTNEMNQSLLKDFRY